MAELIGENKVTLNTAAYFNPNVQSGQTRAGIEMPDYAAKYMDVNDIIHPAVIYLTDEYGYDKDYYTDEDQPKAGTRSGGEYQFITGEELAQGTRFSVNRNIGTVQFFRGCPPCDNYPNIVHKRYIKKGTSATPCTCALKPLIFEFSDSAEAFECLSLK